jgi:hypothetical protein
LIRPSGLCTWKEDVDARVKPAHDGQFDWRHHRGSDLSGKSMSHDLRDLPGGFFRKRRQSLVFSRAVIRICKGRSI